MNVAAGSRSARALAAAFVLVACVSCSNERTEVPGKPCLRNSDCTDPFVCTYTLCHEACSQDSDCPSGQRCVWAGVTAGKTSAGVDAANVRVCLLQDMCALNSACPDPLVCGRDLRCRNECAVDRDCADKDQRCVIGGPNGEMVCAEPPAIVNGVLMSKIDGGAAADAAPDTSADGAGDDAAADSATGDAMDVPFVVDAAADVSPPDAPVDAAAPDAAAICGPDEKEPNDLAEQAQPLAAGANALGCIATTEDVDFYTVESPAEDKAGGFFQAAITDVGNGALRVRVTSATDNGTIVVSQIIEKGVNHDVYWAAASGQKFHVALEWLGAKPFVPFKYTLKAAYTKIADTYEPNDTAGAAAPITLGTPVTAYFFAGFTGRLLPNGAQQDWYSVTLAPGTANVKVENVATDLLLRVRVLDANGVMVAVMSGTGANRGASINGSFQVPAQGPYRLAIESAAAPGEPAKASNLVPESFTKPYTLTVSQ